MPGISVEKLTLSMVISRFMRRATAVNRSIWKPSVPPPSFGMACGAKVPSTPVRSGGSLVWASAEPASNSAAAIRTERRTSIGSAPMFGFAVVEVATGILAPSDRDHERLVSREPVRDQLRRPVLDQDDVLQVPVQALRLDGEDHAFLEDRLAAPAQYRLLLMEPRTHAVPYQRGRVVDPALPELRVREVVDLARGDARVAALDRHAVNLQRQVVAALLLGIRLSEYRQPRLMAGIALEVGDVVVADEIPGAEAHLALAAIHHHVRARIQDSVNIAASFPHARGHHARVHLALGLAVADGREILQQHIVQQVAGPLLQRHFAGSLYPAHLVHQ